MKKKDHSLLFIFITIFIDITGLGIIIPVIPALITELINGSISEAAKYSGWLMFSYASLQFLFAPFLGGLSDQYGRRPVILLSLFGFGVNYLVVVNGTYGLEFFNSNHKDAAFIISSGIPTDDWTINGLPLRPDNDVYVNSHQYSYTVSGNGNPMLFSFTDLNGTYSDNAGSLSFSVYKLGCANIDTVYTCSGDSTGSSSISATGGVPFDPDGIPNSGDEYYNFTWNYISYNY